MLVIFCYNIIVIQQFFFYIKKGERRRSPRARTFKERQIYTTNAIFGLLEEKFEGGGHRIETVPRFARLWI